MIEQSAQQHFNVKIEMIRIQKLKLKKSLEMLAAEPNHQLLTFNVFGSGNQSIKHVWRMNWKSASLLLYRWKKNVG